MLNLEYGIGAQTYHPGIDLKKREFALPEDARRLWLFLALLLFEKMEFWRKILPSIETHYILSTQGFE